MTAMVAVRLGPRCGGPNSLVELECFDFVHYFHVGNFARSVTNSTGLDLCRDHAAIGSFACIEVATVLSHMLGVQIFDMTGRTDRSVWRNNAIIRQYCRIIDVERRAKYLGRINREVCIAKMAAFAVVQPSRIGNVERVHAAAETADIVGLADLPRRMDTMDHVFEIDWCVIGTQFG